MSWSLPKITWPLTIKDAQIGSHCSGNCLSPSNVVLQWFWWNYPISRPTLNKMIEREREKGVEHITLEMEWIVGFSYVPCLTSMSVGWPVFPTLLLISVFRILHGMKKKHSVSWQEHVQAEFLLFTSCSGENMTLFTLTWEVHSKGRLVIWVYQLPSRQTPSLW